MQKFPSIPRIENAPAEIYEEGHLWLLEKVDGANFRFQLQQSGLIHFGNRNTVYEDPAEVPDPYQHAVRHIRERLDRNALREAVDNVEHVVFFGEAMHYHSIEYDWENTPSFLGFDVWTEERGFVTPDTVEGIYERLNLDPVHAVERELPARDFDPDSFAMPESAYYDGPAEGVVVRNKRGGRAKLLHPEFREVEEAIPYDASPAKLAAKFATERRFEKLAAKLQDREEPVTFDALYDRVLEDILREEHARLVHGPAPVEMDQFRSEVAALTRNFLEEWRE